MLNVDRDMVSPADSSSPARRLLLSHYSYTSEMPGLFLAQEHLTKDTSFGPFNRFHFHRSGLDVWFEDEHAAEHALRVIRGKIGKAKAKRGNRLRDLLSEAS